MLTFIKVKGVDPSKISALHAEIKRLNGDALEAFKGHPDILALETDAWNKAYKDLEGLGRESMKFFINFIAFEGKVRVLKCALKEEGDYEVEVQTSRLRVQFSVETDSYSGTYEYLCNPGQFLYGELYKLLGVMSDSDSFRVTKKK